MPALAIRALVLLLVLAATMLLIWTGQRFVETRRQRALNSIPQQIIPDMPDMPATPVRILAFSSADCRQCHTLQAPALKRVLEHRNDTVAVLTVDAPTAPELTQQYQVLTVPTTVVLDVAGKAHAINYGFASTQRLLEQVDEILAITQK